VTIETIISNYYLGYYVIDLVVIILFIANRLKMRQ